MRGVRAGATLVSNGRLRADGFSLPELLIVVSLSVTLMGLAMPSLLASLDDARAGGAARYLMTRLAQARMEAIKRSRDIGLRFELVDTGYRIMAYADGNRNGIRTRDIVGGVDPLVGWPDRLEDHFDGAGFGLVDGADLVDPDQSAARDPIRLGRADILTFTPLGTATPGSLYVRGRGRHQYVVRINGVTARVHLLKFDFGIRRWVPQ